MSNQRQQFQKTCAAFIAALSLCALFSYSINAASADTSINGDPYVDELLSNAVRSDSPYWSGIKELLTNGKYDDAIKECRSVMARRVLDIDMHTMYAMALEMKYHKVAHDPAIFDECVKEWAHVAKVNIFASSKGWEHIGDGEVFVENKERKNLATRHLISLVGRAPKRFETEEAFLNSTIHVDTSVKGVLKTPSKTAGMSTDSY